MMHPKLVDHAACFMVIAGTLIVMFLGITHQLPDPSLTEVDKQELKNDF